jgi:glycosyltransferase involved in cell wall biosynthesis
MGSSASGSQGEIQAPPPVAGRMALVSHTLPPSGNGQAIVLGRLLDGLTHRDCLLLTSKTPQPDSLTAELRGAYLELPPEFRLPIPRRPGLLRMFAETLDALIRGIARAGDIRRMAKAHGAGTLVCCTGEVFELPACAHAAKALGLPFYVYMFDWYAKKYGYMPGLQGKLFTAVASAAEPHLLRAAAGVIVTNAVMQEELRRRYGVDSIVIHNPARETPTPLVRSETEVVQAPARPEFDVVFAGAVYQAHYGAIINLLEAMERRVPASVSLTLYTDTSAEVLARAGVKGPFKLHPRVSPECLTPILAKADILFLPLAFDSPFPEIVRTSLPAKFGDYLASGTPILAHLPPDSFLARYLTQHGCGLVVDRDEPDAVSDGLQRLLEDRTLRQRLARNAQERCRIDFDPQTARQKFERLVLGGHAPAPRLPRAARPRVSVVIPTRNRPRQLALAIESALHQDYENLEVIVVDDGSAPDTSFANTPPNPRVTLIRQENRGPAAARNAGLAITKGEYVAFLDDDDLFCAGKLQRQVQLMESNPDVVMSHTSYARIDPQGGPLGVVNSGTTTGWVYVDIVRSSRIATPTVMVRRAAVPAPLFDERFRIAEDSLAWISIARTSRILGIDEALSKVCIDGRNASTNPRSLIEGIETVLREVVERDELMGPIQKRRLTAEKFMQLASLRWRAGDRFTALGAWLKAETTWPTVPLLWPWRSGYNVWSRLRGRLALRTRLRAVALSLSQPAQVGTSTVPTRDPNQPPPSERRT